MTDKVRKHLEKAIKHELKNSAEKHGKKFSSSHEAYAVIKEEVEELYLDLKNFNENFKGFWDAIKVDDHEKAERMLICSIGSAADAMHELTQVCAMCAKAMRIYRTGAQDE